MLSFIGLNKYVIIKYVYKFLTIHIYKFNLRDLVTHLLEIKDNALHYSLSFFSGSKPAKFSPKSLQFANCVNHIAANFMLADD